MLAARSIGLSALLLTGAACAPRTDTQAPKPLRSESGPKASIHVAYSGGLAYRTINASFRVEQNAYAVVGHLAGDGIIRIVYPETPISSGRVWAGKRVATKAIQSRFDGTPAFYAMGRAPFRTTGAMTDSYDGRGNGFVFVIATRQPMNFLAASDGYAWDDLDVVDYLSSSDPRIAIRELAEQLAGGADYTLRFANSYSTQAFVSYAAAAADCEWLSSLGYWYAPTFWGSWGLGPIRLLGASNSAFYYYPGSRNACYPSYAYSRAYAYSPRDLGRWNRIGIAPRLPQPQGPTAAPVTPTLTRPTYRPIDEPRRGFVAREAFDHRTATARAAARAQMWRDVQSGSEATRPTRFSPSPNRDGVRDHSPRTHSAGGSYTPRSTRSGGAASAPRAGSSSSAPARPTPSSSAPARPATTSTSTKSTTKQQ